MANETNYVQRALLKEKGRLMRHIEGDKLNLKQAQHEVDVFERSVKDNKDALDAINAELKKHETNGLKTN